MAMNHYLSRLPQLARDSITRYFKQEDEIPPVPDALKKFRAGTFITIYTPSGELRGCVGTIAPSCGDVWAETFANARKSAFEDPRFPPLKAEELVEVTFEVSVLHAGELLPDSAELNEMLDPELYGIIVRNSSAKQALLLPGIEGVVSWQQQVSICRQKGNMDRTEKITIERFKVDKFMEEK
ncbi:AmmeMemoRadiSam system protein A [Fibrobacterota bacterium]